MHMLTNAQIMLYRVSHLGLMNDQYGPYRVLCKNSVNLDPPESSKIVPVISVLVNCDDRIS
jgi:hypothetical protein